MLLIGPPGSGKTHFVLTALERAIRERRTAEARLVVPTASMAQHVTHLLARKGCVVPGGLIQTLSDFVEGFTALKEPTAALESYLLKKAVGAAAAPAFSALAKSPGLEAKLASVIAEFQAAGCDARQMQPLLRTPHQQAFQAVFREFENLLERHGYVHRNERLSRAAGHIRAAGLNPLREVYFDGFYHFSYGERQLVEAVHDVAETAVVTFPAGMEHPFENMAERRLETAHRPVVTPAIVSAASPQNEMEEIARLILEGGRSFRDFILIVRSPEVYAPLVQATLERYGIPFRMRAPRPLAQHGSARYLRGLLETIARGFPGAHSLDVVRSPYSPIGLRTQSDVFDFRVRERLPGDGLAFFQEQAADLPVVGQFLDRLGGLAGWAQQAAAPLEWAERCRVLRREWLRLPEVHDGLAMTEALELRELAQALKQFDEAAGEAAEIAALDAGEVPLEAYLGVLDEVLRETPLRFADHRHDVVNVVSVFEARQWESPVAFVCGMVERQFPRYYPQDLFFADAERLQFQGLGFLLRTSAQREQEERSLYAIATTRATEKLVLTYARRDERDQPLLRSFLLPTDYENDRPSAAVRVREKAALFAQDKPVFVAHPELLRELLERHVRFSPSSLESYLQCPFQFFAQRTLRLQGRPGDPERRIDPMLIGTIIHRAIAVWSAERTRPVVEVLDEVFDETLKAKAVHRSFHTELLRYNLRSDLSRFAQETMSRPLGDPEGQKCEAQILYAIDDHEQLFISGRIDRYDVFGDNSGLVVDYKYSSDSRVKGIMSEHEQGVRLQAPLYLLGLQKNFGIRPAGMRFWGLRRKTSLMGWVAEGVFPKEHMLVGDEALSPEDLEAKLVAALLKAREAIDEIRAGRIAVEPRDQRFCQLFCDFRDVCRVEL